MGFSSKEEQRNCMRIDMGCVAKFRINGNPDWLKGKTKNLSATGVQIETTQMIDIGTIVDVLIQPRSLSADSLEIKTEVVRVVQEKNSYKISLRNI